MINLDAADKNVAKLNELVNKFGFEVRIPAGSQNKAELTSANRLQEGDIGPKPITESEQ